MRITNRMIANNLNRGIQRNLSQVARSQEQLATGKSMLRPSDRPENLSQLLSIKATLSYMVQYDRNLDDGLSYLNLNDSSMQTLGDILNQSAEMAVQGANGTMTREDMAALGEQVDKMIDHVVDLANSSVGGRYIYAGTKNSSPPFKRIGDTITYTGDLNGIYREVLSGENYRIDAPGITTGFRVETVVSSANSLPEVTQRQVPAKLINTGIITVTRTGPGTFTITNPTTLDGVTPAPSLANSFSVAGDVITVNGAADELEGLQIDMTGAADGDQFKIVVDSKLGVFGHGKETAPGVYEVYNPTDPKAGVVDEGIFDAMFRLRDNLRNGDNNGTSSSIGEIRNKLDQLLERRVGIGARARHFEALKDQILDLQTKLTESQSQLEDADIYRLSISMSQDQVVFQASLASGANIMKVTLLDFLK
ncbi:MAG: flagellar hook-associated protein FlgL [Firmicutes bacterium]|nr:flagellar hook-associated protein FlgL [Bacillota bacterium]